MNKLGVTMKKICKDTLIKWIFIILSLTGLISATCLIMVMLIYFRFWLLILTIFSVVICVVFYYLARLKYRGYKLKYFFSNKKYNEEIEESLTKFKGAPEWFISEFKYETKRRYRYAGYLFSRDTNDLIYKDKTSKDTILSLYQKLYQSIVSKQGFIEFFDEIEKMNFESSWFIHNYMINDLISNELEYLLDNVYNKTNYTIFDNGLSSTFTERNNQIIKEINEVYSPLLFNFKDEIETILMKLK